MSWICRQLEDRHTDWWTYYWASSYVYLKQVGLKQVGSYVAIATKNVVEQISLVLCFKFLDHLFFIFPIESKFGLSLSFLKFYSQVYINGTRIVLYFIKGLHWKHLIYKPNHFPIYSKAAKIYIIAKWKFFGYHMEQFLGPIWCWKPFWMTRKDSFSLWNKEP